MKKFGRYSLTLILSMLVFLILSSIVNAEDYSLVGYWTLDSNDVIDSTVIDRGSGFNNGNLVGSKTLKPGIKGESLLFFGDNYITIPPTNDLNFGVGEFTLCAWFQTTGQEEDIISNNWRGNYGDYLMMVYREKLRGHINLQGGGSNTIDSVATVNDGKWHLGCQVVDDRYKTTLKSQISLYVDGSLDGSRVAFGTRQGQTDPIYITRRAIDADASAFNGLIDEVRIYNRALASSEILNLYNSGIVDPDTNPTLCASQGYVWVGDKCCGDDGVNDDYPGCVDGKKEVVVVDPDASSSLCASKGYTWTGDKCCGDDGLNDDYPGCVDGKIDSDRDGISESSEGTSDKCPNTLPTEIGNIITDQTSQYYGCGPSERPLCIGKVEGNVCQAGPICATISAYNNQANNAVCASIVCDAASSCSINTGCTPCPVQDCNQKDSYLVGCYEDSSGLKREYRDYIGSYEVCESGSCVAKTCEYTVIDPNVLGDFDKDRISDFCDTDPCGQNTFLGSIALKSVGCFCEGNFTNCDKDLNNGCERDASLEGACPGIPRCTTPFTTISLYSGQTCIGPASENALGGMVCIENQYFCYGLCRNVSCDTPTELCKDPKDYDCDGLSNDYEFKYGLAVFDPIDKDHDPDSDGLVNIMEFRYLTNPFDPDTDEDKLTDLREINVTNPLEPDTDKDGLIDGDEVLAYGTDPQLQDTDGDVLFDGDEIQAIIDWLGIVDENAIKLFVQKDGCKVEDGCLGGELGGPDGKKNGPFDQDTDGDGLSDFEEVKGVNSLISNPFDPENTCSFECSVWSPELCEDEDQTQTRTCSQGTNCAGVSYKPKESQSCRSGFAGLEEKVPFFTPLNIIATLVILIGYYLVMFRKKTK